MEETRRVRGWTWLDGWRADIRYAFRSMRRAPGTTALALFSLALAIAPSVTVFSIMDRLFLTPVAVKAPAEIVSIGFRDTRPDAAHRYVGKLRGETLLRYFPKYSSRHCLELHKIYVQPGTRGSRQTSSALAWTIESRTRPGCLCGST